MVTDDGIVLNSAAFVVGGLANGLVLLLFESVDGVPNLVFLTLDIISDPTTFPTKKSFSLPLLPPPLPLLLLPFPWAILSLMLCMLLHEGQYDSR